MTICSITFRDPEGTERVWESAERLTRPKGSDIDAIGVAAILKDPSKPHDTPLIVLQKQWRAPADAVVIEIPAGLMDPGESAEECAIRELKEETGYVGNVIEGSFGVSPVMFNGRSCLLFYFTLSTLLSPLRSFLLRCCAETTLGSSSLEANIQMLIASRSRLLQHQSEDDSGHS